LAASRVQRPTGGEHRAGTSHPASTLGVSDIGSSTASVRLGLDRRVSGNIGAGCTCQASVGIPLASRTAIGAVPGTGTADEDDGQER